MQSRRSLALVTGALLLCLPVLSACGFDQATDRVYTQANGLNYREGDVSVLNGVIAAAQPDSGTLIASLANRSETQSATLQSVAGGDGNTLQGGDFAPITIPPMGFVNLADTGGITVSGSFGAGSILPLTLSFSDGKTITMRVTVVFACQQYAGLDLSTSAGSASASPSAGSSAGLSASSSATPSAGVSASTSSASPSNSEQPTPSPSVTGTAEESGAASASAYACGTTGGTGGSS